MTAADVAIAGTLRKLGVFAVRSPLSEESFTNCDGPLYGDGDPCLHAATYQIKRRGIHGEQSVLFLCGACYEKQGVFVAEVKE